MTAAATVDLVRKVAAAHGAASLGAADRSTPRTWTVEIAGSDGLEWPLARLRPGSRRLRWQPDDRGAFAAAIGTTRRVTPRLGRAQPVPTVVWTHTRSVRLA